MQNGDTKTFELFYEISNFLITEREITEESYYTDSAMKNQLVEFYYDDFGKRSVNLLGSKDRLTFEMNFQDRFVTTNLRNAIKTAVKSYKIKGSKSNSTEPLSKYFWKYVDEYPELFI